MILFQFKPYNTLKSGIYGYKLSALKTASQQTFYLNTKIKLYYFLKNTAASLFQSHLYSFMQFIEKCLYNVCCLSITFMTISNMFLCNIWNHVP